MVRFLVLFFGMVLGLSLLIQIPFVDRALVLPYVEFITYVSGAIYRIFDASVETSQTLISHSNFVVNIKRGCDGIVATIILVSACLAFPAPWRKKASGLIQGYSLIFILNLIRIEVLFALGVNGHMDLFQMIHTYVAQFIVIISAMVYWLYWAGTTRSPAPR